MAAGLVVAAGAMVYLFTGRAPRTVAFDLIRAVEAGLAVAVVLAVSHLARTARAVPEPLPLRLPGTDRTAQPRGTTSLDTR